MFGNAMPSICKGSTPSQVLVNNKNPPVLYPVQEIHFFPIFFFFLLLLGGLLLEALLRHTRKPVDEQRSTHVEDDVHPQKTKVAPSVGIVDVDAGEVCVGVLDSAELAVGGGIGVNEVTADSLDIVTHVLSTG